MSNTEQKYDFYKRTLAGGTETVVLEQSPKEEPQPVAESTTSPGTPTGTPPATPTGTPTQEVPKIKVDFKLTSMIGNLDQTLGKKQKINIDQLFFSQLFGGI